MVRRVLDAAIASGVDARPGVVVGKNADGLRQELGNLCDYAVQEEQLGTGHAVRAAESFLRGTADAVLILYGDNCMIEPGAIRRLAAAQEKSGAAITMLTTTVPDFENWRKPLYDYGRLVRGAGGGLARSGEKKDATAEELSIREVNPCFYCIEAAWLWENLRKLNNKNMQKEYYLTDLVELAINEGKRVETIPVEPEEVLGVNTPEQLEIVRKLSEAR